MNTMKKISPTSPILAFGDSLTFGFGAPEGQSYPTVLSRLSGATIINEGICGEISADGLNRLEKLLAEHKPQLLLLCHGANDMIQKRSLTDLANNLDAMISLAQNRNIQVLLIAVPDANVSTASIIQYQQVAERMNIPLEHNLMGDILDQATLLNDIVHPNALGYQAMAKGIHRKLCSLGAL